MATTRPEIEASFFAPGARPKAQINAEPTWISETDDVVFHFHNGEATGANGFEVSVKLEDGSEDRRRYSAEQAADLLGYAQHLSVQGRHWFTADILDRITKA